MFPLLYCKSDLSLLLLLPPIILGFLYVNKNVISGRNSSLPPVYHYFSVLYDKLDFLRLDSNNRLYPSHSVVCLSFRISFIVCILASVISARFSAIASARAGFFGSHTPARHGVTKYSASARLQALEENQESHELPHRASLLR